MFLAFESANLSSAVFEMLLLPPPSRPLQLAQWYSSFLPSMKRSIDTLTDEWEWERVVKTRKEGGVIGGCSTRRCSSRFASGVLKLGRCCNKVLDKEADAHWEPRACVRVQWRGNWADTWEPKFDEHGKERFQ